MFESGHAITDLPQIVRAAAHMSARLRHLRKWIGDRYTLEVLTGIQIL